MALDYNRVQSGAAEFLTAQPNVVQRDSEVNPSGVDLVGEITDGWRDIVIQNKSSTPVYLSFNGTVSSVGSNGSLVLGAASVSGRGGIFQISGHLGSIKGSCSSGTATVAVLIIQYS